MERVKLTSNSSSDLQLLVAPDSLLDLHSHEFSVQPRSVLGQGFLDGTCRRLNPTRSRKEVKEEGSWR